MTSNPPPSALLPGGSQALGFRFPTPKRVLLSPEGASVERANIPVREAGRGRPAYFGAATAPIPPSGTIIGRGRPTDDDAQGLPIQRRRVVHSFMTSPAANPVTLSEEELSRFARDGFLALDRPVVAPEDLGEVGELLEGLFDKFDRLPRDYAYDLGDVKHHDGPQQTPEINRATLFEPRLTGTRAFARCQDLARQILGDRAECVFDHAICKPPHNGVAIEWHQDLAYRRAPRLPWRRWPRDAEHLAQVHIWLALQDVTEANGCVHFIPDEGRHRLLPHHRRGIDSHALIADDFDPSAAVACPLAPGMVTIHRPTNLHSSGPNITEEPRLGWILQFRETTRVRAARSKVKRSLLRWRSRGR